MKTTEKERAEWRRWNDAHAFTPSVDDTARLLDDADAADAMRAVLAEMRRADDAVDALAAKCAEEVGCG